MKPPELLNCTKRQFVVRRKFKTKNVPSKLFSTFFSADAEPNQAYDRSAYAIVCETTKILTMINTLFEIKLYFYFVIFI